MARSTRKSRLREMPLAKVKDDLSNLLREAANGEIVITRHGKPAGVLIGFASEDDWSAVCQLLAAKLPVRGL